MHHAWIFSGPAGVGKCTVAEELARILLDAALDPSHIGEPEPVLATEAGTLLMAGTHPDLQVVSFAPTKDGSKLRTEIVIDQVREVAQKLALTPQYGQAQVAILDPADAINRAACNALLKTLEEPAPGRYLWLVSAQPARLPATIRSRCQRIEFRLPPHDEALAWLRAQGHAEADAQRALDAARGHPGLADDWLRHDGLALREAVARDLKRLEQGEIGVVETAQRWANDELADARLRHAADLALEQAGRIGLTDPARLNKLATWFDAANRTRDLLRTTVRADLAMVELLLAWAGSDRGRAVGARRG